ncbi:hypothetical protein [Brevibacillus fulvus]|uniref:Uncharacterized protein n=1 Tax=Brevibacillus fulvus TaxID=1125967 RepID=A0A938Y2W8_9BACL|nr:hypothetical protein [Brevibacillus fulvus]MBM7591374.1 hypothetical protein [Brevibacillus fulvus]
MVIEGLLLACSALIFIWFFYAIGKPFTILRLALVLAALGWIPSLIYSSMLIHYAGYFLLPALVGWIAAEILKRERRESSQ